MNVISDVINYVRRIIKSPNNSTISDALIIDYINRFWIFDLSAIMQLYDLKTQYSFQTTPGVSSYNMPLYRIQTEAGDQDISYYPVYNQLMPICLVAGIAVPFYTQTDQFWNLFPKYSQILKQVGTGDGTPGPYQFLLDNFPAVPGHIDMAGMIRAGYTSDPMFTNEFIEGIPVTSVSPGIYINYTDDSGRNITITDSGQFLGNATDGNLYGLLMSATQPYAPSSISPTYGLQIPPPDGGISLGSYSMSENTVNYNEGTINVTFPNNVPAGTLIQAQSYFYQTGIPRALLFYNNTITLWPPPDTQYPVTMNAYLSPAAFLSSSEAVPYAWMSELIARGAARKILSDTGDIEQLQLYEPFYKEQLEFVWKRSQRIFTSTRTPTIFTDGYGQSISNTPTLGGS